MNGINFAEGMKSIMRNLDTILEVPGILTDEKIALLKAIDKLDIAGLEKVVLAAEKVEAAKQDILTAENGLHDIRAVLKVQNQVSHVSNIRDSVGLIAGSLDEIKVAADYANVFGAVVAMKPMLDEVLVLSVKMDKALDLEEKMDAVIEAEARIDVKLKEMRELEQQASKASILAVDILNNINTKEHRIAENTKKIEEIFKSMNEFHVKVNHVGSMESAASAYDRTTNRLDLNIPMGKTGPRGNHKGDKGNPGKNGSNFVPSYLGTIMDRNKYNSYPTGTSFLSLDEIPTMIYFRKSNAMNDWTDGQPFGVSNGGYSDDEKGIDIVNGINIDELTNHILLNLKRREDGSSLSS